MSDVTDSTLAKARARVQLRPWKIGVIVDASDPSSVKEAVANLSSVWGGIYMPILDANLGTDQILHLASQHGVDSLYSEIEDEEIAKLTRKSGWAWQGRGPAGPFGEDSKYLYTGLLPVQEMLPRNKSWFHPQWPTTSANDLVYAVSFGLRDRFDRHFGSADVVPQEIGLAALQRIRHHTSNDVLCLLQAGEEGIWADVPVQGGHFQEIFVLAPDDVSGAVHFWNRRALGFPCMAVPVDADQTYLDFLRLYLARESDVLEEGQQVRSAGVYGLERVSESTAVLIEKFIRRSGSERQELILGGVFGSVSGTEYERTSRISFRPEDLRVDVDLPKLPVKREGRGRRGIIAAEVSFYKVHGLDPRLTLTPPPMRAISKLARAEYFREDYEHARISEEGWVLGIDALEDSLSAPAVFVLEAVKALLGSSDVSVKQSDIGKFQSRAAEKFGGPFSGFLNQPGVRAALQDISRSQSGRPFPRIRETIRANRGAWHSRLVLSPEADQEYATRVSRELMASGVLVPMLSIHCAFCRTDTRMAVESLGNRIRCEFCGQSFDLALSQALKQPEWTYRLAGHLQVDQLQSLLPVLAATSVLRQFRHVEGDSLMHLIGLEVDGKGICMEADFAVYLPDGDYTMIIGEAKNSNPIDQNDLQNLRALQQRFWENGVRTVISLVTLKDELSCEEKEVIRSWCESTWAGMSNSGHYMPVLPLILTASELSQHPNSDEHPWLWETGRYHGVMGKAIASCKKNLGLVDWNIVMDEGERVPALRWE